MLVTATVRQVREAAGGDAVCFKCHADSANKPQQAGADTGFGGLPVRQVNDFNKRIAFDPNGISYHPVAQAGTDAVN